MTFIQRQLWLLSMQKQYKEHIQTIKFFPIKIRNISHSQRFQHFSMHLSIILKFNFSSSDFFYRFPIIKNRKRSLNTKQDKMFRFFMNSQLRKLSSELQDLDLFSDTLPIKLQEYQMYFRHLVVIEPGLTKHIELLTKEKLTPVRYVKVMVFVHCWLQATCVIEEPETVLNFINHLFKEISASCEKTKKSRHCSEQKMTRSDVPNLNSLRFQQVELSKQLFLMEELAQPYLYYLQKLIGSFDFYNTLKKNFIRPMGQSQIWVLVNLFHNIEKITNNVSAICKFIRKSYRPLAEALAQMFSQDIANFYPKLYKYSYGQANKLKTQFFQTQNEQGEAAAIQRSIESIDGMVNLLTEIKVINKSLRSLYEEPVIRHLDNIYVPKVIETEGRDFQFILHLQAIKKENEGNYHQRLTTPKFMTIQIEAEVIDSDQGQESTIFKDITNEDDLVTFRKEEINFKAMLKRGRMESEGDEPKIANSYEIQLKH